MTRWHTLAFESLLEETIQKRSTMIAERWTSVIVHLESMRVLWSLENKNSGWER